MLLRGIQNNSWQPEGGPGRLGLLWAPQDEDALVDLGAPGQAAPSPWRAGSLAPGSLGRLTPRRELFRALDIRAQWPWAAAWNHQLGTSSYRCLKSE